MSQKFLDLAGLTAYDGKIKSWFKSSIDDIMEDPIRALFAIPDNPYVTFTAEEAGSTVGLGILSSYQTLQYSTDTYTWNTFDETTNITLDNVGDKVYVRGVYRGGNHDGNFTAFNMTGKIAASGNCNAIWNYQDLETPLKEYCGYSMFKYCTSLTKAPELPATSLAERCYQYMFEGCTSLTKAPELPATSLADYCYSSMFEGCTSLTKAPELPAKSLAIGCYSRMFEGCTSLTQAPELQVKRPKRYCYYYMFYGCSNLNYIKCLATNISASYCTHNWVSGVASTGTFIKHPDMNNWTTGTKGIPEGWKVENAEL